MNIDFFERKFKAKTNEELEMIVKCDLKFVVEARIAALRIIKSRQNIAPELEVLMSDMGSLLKKRQLSEQNIWEQLNVIPLNNTKSYRLKNGNELQVKKLSAAMFQIRLEHYNSMLCPVILCKRDKDGKLNYYPFLYLKSILIFSVTVFLLLVYHQFTDDAILEPVLFSLLPLFAIAIQLFLLPFSYPNTLRTFKQELSA